MRNTKSALLKKRNHQKIQINSFMFCDVSQIMHTAEANMKFYIYRIIKLTWLLINITTVAAGLVVFHLSFYLTVYRMKSQKLKPN